MRVQGQACLEDRAHPCPKQAEGYDQLGHQAHCRIVLRVEPTGAMVGGLAWLLRLVRSCTSLGAHRHYSASETDKQTADAQALQP